LQAKSCNWNHKLMHIFQIGDDKSREYFFDAQF